MSPLFGSVAEVRGSSGRVVVSGGVEGEEWECSSGGGGRVLGERGELGEMRQLAASHLQLQLQLQFSSLVSVWTRPDLHASNQRQFLFVRQRLHRHLKHHPVGDSSRPGELLDEEPVHDTP